LALGLTYKKVILDSASSLGLNNNKLRDIPTPSHPRLLVVSANSEKSLLKRVEDTVAYLQEKPHTVGDLAFTLGERREHLTRRAFALVREPLAGDSFTVAPVDCQDSPETTFVFTGQGAQWPEMGKALIDIFERFRQSIQLLDRALQTAGCPPSWSLEGVFLFSKHAR
jgi:acyl transferase domain-containing protein